MAIEEAEDFKRDGTSAVKITSVTRGHKLV